MMGYRALLLSNRGSGRAGEGGEEGSKQVWEGMGAEGLGRVLSRRVTWSGVCFERTPLAARRTKSCCLGDGQGRCSGLCLTLSTALPSPWQVPQPPGRPG